MANIINTTTVPQGSVSSTQNPQTGGQSSSINGSTKTIQNPVNSSSLNTSGSANGIQLVNQAPTPVSISPSTASTVAVVHASSKPQVKHHINPIAISFVAVLLVAAAVIFMAINRSAKITTEN